MEQILVNWIIFPRVAISPAYNRNSIEISNSHPFFLCMPQVFSSAFLMQVWTELCKKHDFIKSHFSKRKESDVHMDHMASGGSKCSFSSFERSESKASVTTVAPIGSAALIFYQNNFPETCTSVLPCYTLPPKQGSAMWTTTMKLPVLLWWPFFPCATAAAFVATCFLLTWPTKQIWPNNK